MCEPVTIGLMVASTAASMYAQQQAGAAQSAGLRAQAENERMKAADTLQRGAAEQGKLRTEASLAIGEGKLGLAGAGVDVQSGSAVEALAGVRRDSELDVATVRANAARAAWGHNSQADNLEWEAKNATTQAGLAMAGTFLGGAAQVGRYKAGRT